MRTGRLDRIITIQGFSSSQDSYGEEIKTWTDTAKVWANKRNAKGNERFIANQDVATVDAIFTIRYRAGITPLMRILDVDGREHNILSVIEVDRKRWLEIYAQARADIQPVVPTEEPPPEEPPDEPGT